MLPGKYCFSDCSNCGDDCLAYAGDGVQVAVAAAVESRRENGRLILASLGDRIESLLLQLKLAC